VVASVPGLGEILATDWKKAAMFYALFGITEAGFRLGVSPAEVAGEDLRELAPGPYDGPADASRGIAGAT
jgi:hypothetical protein